MPIQLSNGYDMYYEVHGNGEPFVWVHGSMGGGEGSAGSSTHHASRLANRFQLILYDRRAARRSETQRVSVMFAHTQTRMNYAVSDANR